MNSLYTVRVSGAAMVDHLFFDKTFTPPTQGELFFVSNERLSKRGLFYASVMAFCSDSFECIKRNTGMSASSQKKNDFVLIIFDKYSLYS